MFVETKPAAKIQKKIDICKYFNIFIKKLAEFHKNPLFFFGRSYFEEKTHFENPFVHEVGCCLLAIGVAQWSK